MSNTLSRSAAKQLIEFIFNSNYKMSPFGEGVFNSKEEALSFVNSAKYDENEPLNVVFDCKKGNYWDGAQMSFDGVLWYMEDHGMGGKCSDGKTIQEALVNFRLKHDPSCQYYPEELKLK